MSCASGFGIPFVTPHPAVARGGEMLPLPRAPSDRMMAAQRYFDTLQLNDSRCMDFTNNCNRARMACMTNVPNPRSIPWEIRCAERFRLAVPLRHRRATGGFRVDEERASFGSGGSSP